MSFFYIMSLKLNVFFILIAHLNLFEPHFEVINSHIYLVANVWKSAELKSSGIQKYFVRQDKRGFSIN